MKINQIVILILLAIGVSFSSITSAKVINSNYSLKDPGVINKERILYWLTKRGEIKADASDDEKRHAIANYLKVTENRNYKLPPEIIKFDSKQDIRLKSTKAGIVTTKNVLAILIDFEDLPYDANQLEPADTNMYYSDYSVAHYSDLIFGTNEGYRGPDSSNDYFISAKQYYEKVSGDSMTLQGTVVGWVRANDADPATYGANDPDNDENDIDVQSLVKEAIDAAVAKGGFDLADFDSDSDGYIDHVMIYHSSVGEEAGGGVLGDDAIWSHRFAVDWQTGGYVIKDAAGNDSGYKIYDYTIQPIDAAAGVVVHEFGHDLGVGDEYNTDSSDDAHGSPVGYWSIMASGSWAGSIPGTQPTGFSPLAAASFQQRYGGNWHNPIIYNLNDLVTDPQSILLNDAANHQDGSTNLIKVDLPKSGFTPKSGNFQYYSGQGDNFTHSMEFNVDVPAVNTSAQLQMKSHWNIEVDWDYVQVFINSDTNPDSIVGSHTKANNAEWPDIHNFITGASVDIEGAGAPDSEGWVNLTFDVPANLWDSTITVKIIYVTDTSVGGYGFIVDDIELLADSVSTVIDDAEIDGVATLTGFKRNSLVEGEGQNYWIQMRSYEGVDVGLSAENSQRGILVWFEDQNYSDNHVNLHPGHGFIGVVDAGQEIVRHSVDIYCSDTLPSGTPCPTTTQIKDATFTGSGTTFNDGADYSTPEQPASGMILPNNGLNISIQSQDPDSRSATLLFSVGEVAWTSEFSYEKDFRTVTFSNQSAGTGNSSASWDFGDDSTSTERNPTHIYAASDTSKTFDVILTVTTTSSGVTIDSTPQTITIAEELSTSFNAQDNNGVVSFTTSSSGGEGPYTYTWDFDDNSAAGTGISTTHTYATSGEYDVILTVTSADNQTATSTKTVSVYILPVAGYTFTTSNLMATFTNASTGGDGNLTYAWYFGGSGSSTDASPSHTYTSAGTYTVVLTITDGLTNTSERSQSVTVTAPPSKSGGGGGSMGVFLLGLLLLRSRFRNV